MAAPAGLHHRTLTGDAAAQRRTDGQNFSLRGHLATGAGPTRTRSSDATTTRGPGPGGPASVLRKETMATTEDATKVWVIDTQHSGHDWAKAAAR